MCLLVIQAATHVLQICAKIEYIGGSTISEVGDGCSAI